MATTGGGPKRLGDDDAMHFVVELITADGPRYALCRALTVVAAGAESLPASDMAAFMARGTLRAVAVPSGGDAGGDATGTHWTMLAQNFQSGHEP